MCRVRCYVIALELLCLSLVVDLSATQSCGKRKVVDFLIVNGDEAKDGYWPWHAAIFHNNGRFFAYECGGTILDQDTVLTAAHCVMTTTGIIARRRLIVQVGRHRLSVAGKQAQEHGAFEFIVHPEYNFGSIRHDIALVRLTSDITYNDYVQPICLWNRGEDLHTIIGSWGTVIGFGIDETGNVSDILREATIPVVSHINCIESNRNVFAYQLTSNMFCAGNRDGIAACNGDSGGGIFFNYSDTWFIRGVVSFTKPRQHGNHCDPKEYTVFTDVAKYLGWIEQHIRRTGGQLTVSWVDENRNQGMLPISTRNDTDESLLPTISNQRKQNDQQTHGTSGKPNNITEQLIIPSIAPPFVDQEKRYEHDTITYVQPTLTAFNVSQKIGLLPMYTCGDLYQPFEYGYPWLAQLVCCDNVTFCQATLISELYLISTAQCVNSIQNKSAETFVRLGATECHEKWINIETKDGCSSNIQTIRIKSLVKHPNYDGGILNNIALIRLQNRADTSEINVKPICLPVTSELLNHKSTHYILTSWSPGAAGKHLYSSLHESVDTFACLRVLRRLVGTITTEQTDQIGCIKQNRNYQFWNENCLFLWYGAPIQRVQQVQEERRYVLHGVFLLQHNECDLSYPFLYTNVANHMDFILENIQE